VSARTKRSNLIAVHRLDPTCSLMVLDEVVTIMGVVRAAAAAALASGTAQSANRMRRHTSFLAQERQVCTTSAIDNAPSLSSSVALMPSTLPSVVPATSQYLPWACSDGQQSEM